MRELEFKITDRIDSARSKTLARNLTAAFDGNNIITIINSSAGDRSFPPPMLQVSEHDWTFAISSSSSSSGAAHCRTATVGCDAPISQQRPSRVIPLCRCRLVCPLFPPPARSLAQISTIACTGRCSALQPAHSVSCLLGQRPESGRQRLRFGTRRRSRRAGRRQGKWRRNAGRREHKRGTSTRAHTNRELSVWLAGRSDLLCRQQQQNKARATSPERL
jgi:hypothetical protein